MSMVFPPALRAGVRAAVPIWIAFVPSSLAFGIAAQAQGLAVGEVVFMSAIVYSGPAQFAALEPLASGRGALQILLTSLLINLRFLPMSSALAPYFRGARRRTLLWSAHFVSASSFIIPYLHFQKSAPGQAALARNGTNNLYYFLGVGVTSFSVWVTGTGAGYLVALSVPRAFDEGLRFILPGYFACLLVTEVRGRAARLVCLCTLVAAVPGALLSPEWGWMLVAVIIATAGWGIEQWNPVTSR